ncbi:hypothetical protein HPE56_11780, partial [Maribacter sp. ANRC-HE7]|nr:hypothetical protein [Maribacter aquimaris]
WTAPTAGVVLTTTAIDGNGQAGTPLDIADDAITSSKIALNTIIADDINTGAVTTDEILNGTILAEDIADDAVTSAKIAPNTIIADDINTGAITTDEILNGTILSEDIADANVTEAKINPSTTNGEILTTVAGVAQWTDPTTVSPFHALGKINITAIDNSTNISGIINIGPGNYQVNFSSAASSANYVIQLTVSSPGKSIYVTNQNSGNFSVQIEDLAGLPTDAIWFFTVTDF